METATQDGPLTGLKVIEFSSIGPGPHCAMLLADLGAEVLRIDRPGGNGWPNPVVDRGRSVIAVDIRSDEGHTFAMKAAKHADVVLEGFRPGVMERLGLGPDVLCEQNPRLIYGRMTGWGQEGPLSKAAGHDINYIALAGALAAIGKADEPAQPPLNLIGDFGGGSLYLAFGIMAALYERNRSGKGQVVDAAIIDGVSSLMTMFSGLLPSGRISMERDKNLLAGAAPFYRTYICADGREIAIGPLEPQFYAEFLTRAGINDLEGDRENPTHWPTQSQTLEALFRSKTSAEWSEILENTDACFAPVLDITEAPDHPHMAARNTYVVHDGLKQAAPAPRFSRTPGRPRKTEENGEAIIERWSRELP